ncbi:ABC transporter substrate-binding protein [Paenibacillus paridis]|uniref:ABC transporter substrate-binding protein n=1 Tax=Paenibacillus paridis TaxID=2583376 RepID=UPI0011239370|nr:ABC transporter substrate-binding protein [Paenibacillus paridis]
MVYRKKGWSLFCTIIVLVLVLAACGGGEGKEDAGAVQTEQASASPEIQSTDTRIVEHVLGKIEIPAQPKNVIGLFVEDEMSALGVKPIMQYSSGAYYQTYLEDYLKDVPKLDTAAFNFEAIMAAQPDLIILGFQGWAEEGTYEKLSKIAPTYVFTGSEIQYPQNWKKNLLIVADLLGKTEQAELVIKKREAETKLAKEQLQVAAKGKTAAMIRIHASKELRLYGGPGGQVGTALYGDFGLEPAPIIRKLAWGEDMDIQTISMEIIPQIDADYIFLAVDEGRENQAEELKESSMWKNIPAVQQGHVFEVRGDVWITNGPLAYEKKLENVMSAIIPNK